MIFTSGKFIIFILIFFYLYWFIFNKSLRAQNFLVLLGNYIFYAFGSLSFLPLLIFNSIYAYFLAHFISNVTNESYKKWLLLLSVAQGLMCLIIFKYFNFILHSFDKLFGTINIHLEIPSLELLLPLGISFYTFRSFSYLLDVYKGKVEPISDWVSLFAYISFFPTLISGPIDKSSTFLPQINKQRIFSFDEANEGLRQILWGLFKKMVIADNCATLTTPIFANYNSLPASTLYLGAVLYTIQIYADFSGYSDMAIGLGRLLGFNITKNFNYPLFSKNIVEFWRKWHISLTSWLTEYVFTPLSLAFRDLGKTGLILAILLNFTLIGIWHGPNWTFVLFGFLNGCYFIPFIIKGTLNKKKDIKSNTLLTYSKDFIQIFITFNIVTFTFIIFKSDSVYLAYDYLLHLFSYSLLSPPTGISLLRTGYTLFFITFMLGLEWLQRDKEFATSYLGLRVPKIVRWSFHYFILFVVFIFSGATQNFIYFQF